LNDFPEPTQDIRRHTGAIGLVLEGDRPLPKETSEILAVARAANFYEDGAITREYEGGSIQYVPTMLSSNAVVETIMEGRLLYRFTITGDPPVEFQALTEGTYMTYVDFIEGPDVDEGRWIGWSRSPHDAMPPLWRHPEADGVQVGGSHGSDRASP
jgi:hypothetical protein